MFDDYYRSVVSRNLRYYMALFQKTQIDFVRDLGFDKSAVSTWVNGTRLPRMDKIDRIATYLGIKRSDLIEEKNEAKRRGVVIPVVGDVAAGIPIEAIEDIVDYEEITEELASTGEYFGLRIKGDSMAPDIRDGDTVIVRVQPDVDSGDIAVFKVNGDTATCKRLMKYAQSVSLVSSNPAYEPMYFSHDDLKATPIAVIGKVVELRRKMI